MTPATTPARPADRLRRTSTRALRGAGQAVLAALRPQASPWSPPWSRWPRVTRLLPAVLALYGVVVAIAAAGSVLDGRGGLAGGVAFLLLLPAVAGVALAAVRPLDGWLLVTCWLLALRFLLTAPQQRVPVLEPWAWLLWVPVLALAAMAARGRAAKGVPLLSALVLLLAGVLPWTSGPYALVPALVMLSVPLALGAAMGSRQSARAALRTEQVRAEEALARQGALAERARIAREMHDVVAHSMSMVAVRAETAPYRLGGLPDRVLAEFAEVAGAARQSLAEMQDLLGVLRSDDRSERAPQPGLADVGCLLDAARAAGAAVTAQVVVPEVPPALGLTAYRIVQQGLANAAQHAPGAPVRVCVADEDGVLRVEVVNGPGQAVPTGPGGGNGLPGMRERAALHGGTVEAGSLPGGGFALVATLPLRAGVPA